MNAPRMLPTKLQPPAHGSTLARPRLLARAAGAGAAPVIWLHAPAGAGKSRLLATLAARRREPLLWYQVDAADRDVSTLFHYLGVAASALLEQPLELPEFQPGAPVGLDGFARRFFRRLFELLPDRLALFFDDHHEAASEPGWQVVFRELLAARPPRVRMFVASRRAPPPALVRFRAQGELEVLGFDELRFDVGEVQQLLRKRKVRARDSEALAALSGGWAIVVALLASTPGEEPPRALRQPATSQPRALQLAFDYLAGEVLDRLEPRLRELLQQLALLPVIDAALAVGLTGDAGAAELLERLANEHALLEPSAGGQYRLHALLRELLLERGRSRRSPERQRELLLAAARLLGERGHFEDATRLLAEAEEWPLLVQVIERDAPVLARQGRVLTVQAAIERLPIATREQHPWLSFWSALSLLGRSPSARMLAEQAFARFLSAGELVGVHLAWSLVVQAIVLESNDFPSLLHWLQRLRELPLPPPVPESALRVAMSELLGWAHNGTQYDTAVAMTVERALLVVLQHGKENERLLAVAAAAQCTYLCGQPERGRQLLERERPRLSTIADPLAKLWFLYADAFVVCNIGGDFRRAEALMHEALRLIREEGLSRFSYDMIGFGVVAALARGDLGTAAKHLAMAGELPSADVDFGRASAAFHGYQRAWLALERDDYPGCDALLDECDQLAIEMGFRFGIYQGHLSRLICASYRGGALALQRTLLASERVLADAPTPAQGAAAALAMAHAKLCLGSCSDAELTLALARTRQVQLIGGGFLGQRLIARVCKAALEQSCEVEFVRRWIALYEIAADDDAVLLEHWPWPIKIRVFGGVQIEVAGEVVGFGRKAPVALLALLQLLVATDKPISASKALAALWPGYGAAAPRATLDTALYRLRKLLGGDAVLHTGGTLALDRSRCWTDVRALNLLCERLGASAGKRTLAPDVLLRQQRMLSDLYRGPCAGDGDPLSLQQLAQQLERRRALAQARLEQAQLRSESALRLA